MSKQQSHVIDEIVATASLGSTSPCIGRLAGTSNQTDILVEYEGSGPKPAKFLASLKRGDLAREDRRGREVLLVFEKGDPERPIIIGLMESPLEDLLSSQAAADQTAEVKDILVDGRRITIEAENEILLRCGKGSILLRKDGKIIIKGTDLLSRSSGRQRVRGASVSIN